MRDIEDVTTLQLPFPVEAANDPRIPAIDPDEAVYFTLQRWMREP